MRLLTTYTIQHPTENKYLRLYQGDLARITPGEEVDLLVVSARKNDYSPTQDSLIGALDRKGISVKDLARDKQEDLRENFSSWLSKDISQIFPNAGFKRILCFETPGKGSPPEEVGNIFRAIMPFVLGEPPLRTLAMPIIAAGDQQCDPGEMLTALFDAAAHWLARGLPVQTIKLVIHREEQVETLSELFIQLSRKFPEPEKEVARTSTSDHTYDFFLSYANSDSPALDILEQGLTAANPLLRMYRYERELDPGRSWQDELDHALTSCRRVVTLVSPAYLKSPECQEEFSMARVRHRKSGNNVLVPIYLREAPLPLFMETLQYLDCRNADRDRLVKAASKVAML